VSETASDSRGEVTQAHSFSRGAPNGPAANLAVNLFSNRGPVLLAVALGGVGLRADRGEA
jgi:hypothetical protein